MRSVLPRRLRVLAGCVLTSVALCVAPAVADAQFGLASFGLSSSSPQAGAHADFSSTFALNTNELGAPVGQLKTATVALPPGVIGDPQTIERCATRTFTEYSCPPGSQVGTLGAVFVVCNGVSTSLQEAAEAGATTLAVPESAHFCVEEDDNSVTIGSGTNAQTDKIVSRSPTSIELATPLEHAYATGEAITQMAFSLEAPIPLFNLPPSPGHVATFAASILVLSIMVQVELRSDGGLVATIADLPTLLPLRGATLTLWGVPADPSHDAERCNQFLSECGLTAPVQLAPFMTNPTACVGPPMEARVEIESWQDQTSTRTATLAPPTGCELLRISPSLTVAPETTRRDTPSGYEVNVQMPLAQEATTLGTPPLREVSVTLPAGTSLSPAVANGLQACTEAQFAVSGCPNAAKLGTAELITPLLGEHVSGAVYLGSPAAGEPYRVFVELSADGTPIELVGKVELDGSSGQVTTVFSDLPPLPFSDFKLLFFGGPAAAFANPVRCGTATSTSQITSYAGQSASPSSTFTVDANGEGGACAPQQPFEPTFTAGTASPLAGAFSPFTMTVSRADGQQSLSTIDAELAPGLLGLLATVGVCGEPQAATGQCPASSQIGTATVGVGAGSQPLYISGSVYITGPYKGSPYGLSIVIPASVGPFDLGTIVLRAQVLVSSSLQLAIASDPLPQIIGGIPLRVRVVNLTVNRPGLIVNPTVCGQQSVTATLGSAEGASATVSAPFQALGCGALRFAPKLSASTQAKASSRGDGASLQLAVANVGGSANIRALSITLPGRLRPRLTTIQDACLATVYAANPASCPAQSDVGEATIDSPVLPTPLTGTVLLVSRGGTSYPVLFLDLSGAGISVAFEGRLSISSDGAIRTRFSALPDVPISSLHVTFPRGPHSILGAIASLCSRVLRAPYVLTAQNGAQSKGSTSVPVSGCPRHDPPKRAAKHATAKRAAARDSRRNSSHTSVPRNRS